MEIYLSCCLFSIEKRRKAEDLNVLDKQNKIIHDMVSFYNQHGSSMLMILPVVVGRE